MEQLQAGDSRLAPYRDLKDSQLRRRAEAADGVFLIEGRLALQTALSSGYRLLSVLVLARRAPAISDLHLPAGLPVFVVDDDLLEATAGFDVHRGVLALAARGPDEPLSVVMASRPRLVVVVEAVNDQENLGSIFRNSAAFGVGAVLLDPTCTDPLYRRTVRVSQGLALKVPFGRLRPWPAALGELPALGYELVALTPSPAAPRLEAVAQQLSGQPVALVVGAEGDGLSSPVLDLCSPARIAMAPGVDSLNVAAATAVALHCLADGPWQ